MGGAPGFVGIPPYLVRQAQVPFPGEVKNCANLRNSRIRNCPHCRLHPGDRSCRAREEAERGVAVLHREARRIARDVDRLGMGVEDLFHHALAVLHDPAYREANAGALRMEWPRIPLPGWPESYAPGAAEELTASAARGRELAQLLDPETPVPGVTAGTLRPGLATIAVPATTDGGNMGDEGFEVTAGWGHIGSGDAVMPGRGRVEERSYTAEGQAALGDAMATLGDTTFDIYLNGRAYWRNVPANVWSYNLGGYQVLKKWLSYRECKVLGRKLTPEEVQHFTGTARRIAAVLMLTGK